MRGRDKFTKYKKIINLISNLFKVLAFNFRIKLFLFARGINGISGLTLRYCLLKIIIKTCGDNVSIHSNVYL